MINIFFSMLIVLCGAIVLDAANRKAVDNGEFVFNRVGDIKGYQNEVIFEDCSIGIDPYSVLIFVSTDSVPFSFDVDGDITAQTKQNIKNEIKAISDDIESDCVIEKAEKERLRQLRERQSAEASLQRQREKGLAQIY